MMLLSTVLSITVEIGSPAKHMCVSSSSQPLPNHEVFADLCCLSRSITFTCVRRQKWASVQGFLWL